MDTLPTGLTELAYITYVTMTLIKKTLTCDIITSLDSVTENSSTRTPGHCKINKWMISPISNGQGGVIVAFVQFLDRMCHVMRKPVLQVSDQVQYKPG